MVKFCFAFRDLNLCLQHNIQIINLRNLSEFIPEFKMKTKKEKKVQKKTRKQLRKDKRLEKKSKKNEYFMNRNKVGRFVLRPDDLKDRDVEESSKVTTQKKVFSQVTFMEAFLYLKINKLTCRIRRILTKRST